MCVLLAVVLKLKKSFSPGIWKTGGCMRVIQMKNIGIVILGPTRTEIGAHINCGNHSCVNTKNREKKIRAPRWWRLVADELAGYIYEKSIFFVCLLINVEHK